MTSLTAETEEILLESGARPVWPSDQRLMARDGGNTIFRTVFSDTGAYHAALAAHILGLAAQPDKAGQYSRSLGGTKLYDVQDWTLPEARLLNARALAFYRAALGRTGGVIDIGWANVYGRGDYIVPHSHTRAVASVVYCLEEGETAGDDENAGRFSFVDPRFAACCQIEPGRMTNPLKPELKAGTMLLFPGEMVHFVNPYDGDKPRITIAWNVNDTALDGSALEPFLPKS